MRSIHDQLADRLDEEVLNDQVPITILLETNKLVVVVDSILGEESETEPMEDDG